MEAHVPPRIAPVAANQSNEPQMPVSLDSESFGDCDSRFGMPSSLVSYQNIHAQPSTVSVDSHGILSSNSPPPLDNKNIVHPPVMTGMDVHGDPVVVGVGSSADDVSTDVKLLMKHPPGNNGTNKDIPVEDLGKWNIGQSSSQTSRVVDQSLIGP